MEFVFALAVVLLSGLGIGLGLMLTGRPPQGSCGGLACVGGGQCDGCPRHRAAGSENTEEHDG